MSQINPNPLQPIANNNYNFVQQPQSTTHIDPWMNRNPWANPPGTGGQMSPGQIQPMPKQPMPPIPRPVQSGPNVAPLQLSPRQ
jgi:hypothetical protein